MKHALSIGAGVAAVAFLLATVAALIRGDFSTAAYPAVMTLLTAYALTPKRPSEGSVQFRQAVLVALIVDGFALYVGLDFILAATGVTEYNSRTWADVPMFAIASYIGYLVTLSTVRIFRGTFQPRPRT